MKEQQEIEETRDELLRTLSNQDKFNMMEAHVTSKICWTEEEAQAEVDRINELLPLTVAVTGVTID